MQFNSLGVASGVATPGWNISQNSSISICLNMITVDDSSNLESQDVDEDVPGKCAENV